MIYLNTTRSKYFFISFHKTDNCAVLAIGVLFLPISVQVTDFLNLPQAYKTLSIPNAYRQHQVTKAITANNK
ncbi:hypothetical protein A4H97_00210 [Niastella yeongjuensis]|uniref:Uncharacterized protein n=1 Tax=Niastella yeongjuensis TaxID=354355 RepID=A0A1V9EVY6_9BACT|nr:hypothetical protein A4H97_00210 [Niastella yeongjuensis]SEN40300.1 hypothetical protein SAMN05660816_00909 [Niastella yeongjuensis]